MAPPSSRPEPDLNPYAAPRSDGSAPTRFYKLVPTRATYAECWRLTPNLLAFLVLAAFKTLRVRLPAMSGVHYPDRLDTVELDAIPPHILDHWRPAIEALAPLGMRPRLCYGIPAIGIAKEGLALVLSPDDGLDRIALTYIRVESRAKQREVVSVNAGSTLSDGRRAATRDRSSHLDPPPGAVVQTLRGLGPAELLTRHRAWLEANGWTAVPILEKNLAEAILEREQAMVDFQIERGTFIPLTERDYEKLSRLGGSSTPPSTPAERRFFAVLTAIEWSLILVGVIAVVLTWGLSSSGRGDLTHALFLELIVLACLGGVGIIGGIRLARKRRARARD